MSRGGDRGISAAACTAPHSPTVTSVAAPVNPSPKAAKRGFAAMSPERQRAIASKGGKSVAPENRAFSRDAALAARAGQAGGIASHGGRGRA